jgi:hypothetical protein
VRGIDGGRLPIWLLAFLGFFLVSGAWAVATPYDGAPDEREHIVRAAGVVRGQIIAERTDAAMGTGAIQRVPNSLARAGCFGLRPHIPAACPRPSADTRTVPVATRAGRYHPTYYAVAGLPLLVWPDARGVVAARLITAAIVAALLALAVQTVVRWSGHPLMIGGVVVSSTPVLFHLGGAVNPAAVEIAAGVLFFAAGVPLFLDRRTVSDPAFRGALVWRVGLAGVLLATVRAFGPVWLALGLVALLVPWRRETVRALLTGRAARWWIGIGAAAVLFGGLWTVTAKAATLATAPTDGTWNALQYLLVRRWPSYPSEMVGQMSWNDTILPQWVYLTWYVMFGFLVAGIVLTGRWSDRWRIVVMLAGGMAVAVAGDLKQGFAAQGRYLLPLTVGAPILAGYLLSRRGILPPAGTVSAVRGMVLLLLPLHLVALAYTMVRWQQGLSADAVRLNPLRGSWLPAVGPMTPLLLMIAGLAGAAAAYALGAARAVRDEPRPVEPAADAPTAKAPTDKAPTDDSVDRPATTARSNPV